MQFGKCLKLSMHNHFFVCKELSYPFQRIIIIFFKLGNKLTLSLSEKIKSFV